MGPAASAMPTSSKRLSPWERALAVVQVSARSPTLSSISITSPCTSLSPATGRKRRCARLRRARSGIWILSKTASSGKTLTTWKDRQSPLCTLRWVGRRVISSPSKRMQPESGRIEPEMRLMSVDFPAPLGPMMEVRTPGRNVKSMSWAATTRPKDLFNLWISSSGRRIDHLNCSCKRFSVAF